MSGADEKAVAECPFCGGAVVSHGSAPFGKVWAACDRCAASGPEIEGLSCEEAIAAFTQPKHLRSQHEADKAALVALLGEARWRVSHQYDCKVAPDDPCTCGVNGFLTRIDAALKEKA